WTSSSESRNSKVPSLASAAIWRSPSRNVAASVSSRMPTRASIATWAIDALTSQGRRRRSVASTVYRHRISSGADSKRPPHSVMAVPAACRLPTPAASFPLSQQLFAELAETERIEPDEAGGVGGVVDVVLLE